MTGDDKAKRLFDRIEKAQKKAQEHRANPPKPNPLDSIVGDAKSVSDIQAALLDHVAKNAKKDDQ